MHDDDKFRVVHVLHIPCNVLLNDRTVSASAIASSDSRSTTSPIMLI